MAPPDLMLFSGMCCGKDLLWQGPDWSKIISQDEGIEVPMVGGLLKGNGMDAARGCVVLGGGVNPSSPVWRPVRSGPHWWKAQSMD